MENNTESKSFVYSYSAKEMAEIKSIRGKYEAKDTDENSTESKKARIRSLDSSATNAARAAAITLGVIGCLILGFGMSLIMTELAAILSLDILLAIIIGSLTGTLGIAILILAYPLYTLILKHKRAAVAPEILRLTDELMK